MTEVGLMADLTFVSIFEYEDVNFISVAPLN